MPVKCAIVTPTLDLTAGNAAVRRAAKSAGKGIIPLPHAVLDEWGTGGCRPANEALRWGYATGAPFICYINDDVWFPAKGWLSHLVDALAADPLALVAGPSGKCGTKPQMGGRPGMPKGVQVVKQLSYFCACFKREAFDLLGFLDGRFHHWGCDSDFNERVRRAGKRALWVRHAWVDHRTVPHKLRDSRVTAWKQHDVALFRRLWRGGR